ncbi:hypothetical protein [Pseudomonas protegens]|nr:hypothetical protein [Pseudomonas protegens]
MPPLLPGAGHLPVNYDWVSKDTSRSETAVSVPESGLKQASASAGI